LGRYDSRFREITGGQMTTAPMNPLAGVSGPSKYSVRTDKLEMGSTAYGEGVETQAIKSGAPLAQTGDVNPARAGDVREAATRTAPTELFAMSDETRPITAGLDRGPGPGSEALMMNKSVVKLSDSLAAMLPYDNTGEIAVLYQEALAQGN
jgi:hypothetical protein